MNDLIKIQPKQTVIPSSGKEIQTINARDLHEFLEVGRDFSTWIQNRIREYEFIQDIDFIRFPRMGESNNSNDLRSMDYFVSIYMAKELSIVERNKKGKQARKYFIECERQLKEISYSGIVPKSLPEALRLYANEVEMRELAEKQRDEAIRTKAEIGNRREATAMATASAKSREAEKLSEEIGNSKNIKQVKAIDWLYKYFGKHPAPIVYSQIGKKLSRISNEELKLPVKEIDDTTWGKVNAYRIEVINLFKSRLDSDKNYMSIYRIDID